MASNGSLARGDGDGGTGRCNHVSNRHPYHLSARRQEDGLALTAKLLALEPYSRPYNMGLSAAGLKAKAQDKKHNANEAFSSWSNFVEWIQVPEHVDHIIWSDLE